MEKVIVGWEENEFKWVDIVNLERCYCWGVWDVVRYESVIVSGRGRCDVLE